jgi:TPR repeat protein
MKRTFATAFLCVMLATPAWAGYDEGRAAYDRKDYATALREFLPPAERGNAFAQFSLGRMYDYGSGVPEDAAEAVKWYRKAAERGHAWAQGTLGRRYHKGRGVLQDYVQAHMWYNIAGMQRSTFAAERLRDEVSEKMTPADVSKAQKLAREWWAAFKKRKEKPLRGQLPFQHRPSGRLSP